MNTLETLNTWSNNDIPYAGNATYSITFVPTSPVNQTTTLIEDESFVSPVGTNITSMVNVPRDMEYTIDLSGLALPATINWGTLPFFISSQVAGTNIFKLVGPIDETVWAVVKSPTITIPDQATNFTYPATITYPDPATPANDITKTWNITVTVTAVANISTPSPWVYTKNSIGTIAGAPQILNLAAGTYSILITPSQPTYVYLLGSSGTGGTSVFDPVLKTLTITGTKTEVNSHLASVQLTTNTNVQNPFSLAYTLTNPSGAQNTVNQSLTSSEAFTISAATYIEDTPFSLGYSILDVSNTATSFTVSVAQATPLPSVSPGYFTVNGSNVGNTWSITNTRTTINSANVIFTPPVDYTGTITLNVNQSKIDNGNVVVQAIDSGVNIINSGTNPEISNMINRSYLSSQTNTLFPTQIPFISDGADVGQTYTITLSSPIGKIGNSVANALANASYSFTGNMTSCNSQFALIKFLPEYGTSSTSTFQYTQTRGIIPQVDMTLVLTGSPGNITPATYTFTGNTTFSPTFDQTFYGQMEVLSVAGGGGGAATTYVYLGNTYSSQAASGGGGGGVLTTTVNPGDAEQLANTTYTVTIGAGGSGYTTAGDPAGTAGGNTQLTLGATTYLKSVGGNGGMWGASRGGNSGFPTVQSQTVRNIGGLGGSGGGGGYSNAVVGGGGAGALSGGGNGNITVVGSTRRTSGGDGGSGKTANITGANVVYGGGGGGTGTASYGSGGGSGGGGGNPGTLFPTSSRPGVNGKGGGGAGGGSYATGGGAGGGSGILIIKFS